jgi:hypothetical protein
MWLKRRMVPEKNGAMPALLRTFLADGVGRLRFIAGVQAWGGTIPPSFALKFHRCMFRNTERGILWSVPDKLGGGGFCQDCASFFTLAL